MLQPTLGDPQPTNGDGQAEAPRTGRARVEVEHSAASLGVQPVVVATDHLERSPRVKNGRGSLVPSLEDVEALANKDTLGEVLEGGVVADIQAAVQPLLLVRQEVEQGMELPLVLDRCPAVEVVVDVEGA